MAINKADLVASLLASVSSSTKLLDTADITVTDNIVDNALNALSRLAPATGIDTISLQPGVQVYAAPDNLWAYKETSWGFDQTVAPWEPGYVSRMPDVTYNEGNIYFSFAPTAQMISNLGSRFTYFYYARYQVNNGAIEIEPRKQALLLLLCQMEVMKLLVLREPGTQVTTKGNAGKIQYGSPKLAFDALEEEAHRVAKSL
ncbi:hypothetical protein KUL42_09810 [Alteromonas sp. KUL42]|uniref:hypothetical protein n=1 Tax=Alteromonas sp. KUL42 TaxID=2480797 RepID=UPI001035D199|nr:hypothetical protein [Alteromonas sp. KUL42]TAP37770.1 hypothetical protein EYR97_04875 [Alteromonas sp. KUL42]GEA06220.1 hypothetical protein KUL42_09810 [Alteromonas sp. KUL42]